MSIKTKKKSAGALRARNSHGGNSNPIQPLILQLEELGSSQWKLRPQSQQIRFQAFICTAVSTEHQRGTGQGLWNSLSRWFLLQNLLEVICQLHCGKTLIRS